MADQRQPRRVNRRLRSNLTRANLLDVRMRTVTARRRRRAIIFRWVTNVFLVGAVGAGSFFGLQAALDKFFFKKPEYTLRRISFELDEILTRD